MLAELVHKMLIHYVLNLLFHHNFIITVFVKIKYDADDDNVFTCTRDCIAESAAVRRRLDELKFSAADYVVFAVSLAVPVVIGVFFFCHKRRQQSTESFLVGDRSLNVVAVAMSLIASILNGIFIIGLPAEMHYHGTEMTYMAVAAAVVTVLAAHVFIPKYHRMRFTSAYEVGIYIIIIIIIVVVVIVIVVVVIVVVIVIVVVVVVLSR